MTHVDPDSKVPGANMGPIWTLLSGDLAKIDLYQTEK